MLIVVLIQIAFDALLGRFLKLFVVKVDARQLAVSGKHGIESLAILLHDVGEIFIGESHGLGFLEVGINQPDEFLAALDDNALSDHGHGIEFVLDLLRVNVLPAGAEKHILGTPLDEDIALVVHRAQIARMIPPLGVDGGPCGFFVFVIAEHHIQSSCQYLAWHVGWIGAVYFHLHVDDRAAARSGYEGLIVGIRNDRCTFGGSIADREGEPDLV